MSGSRPSAPERHDTQTAQTRRGRVRAWRAPPARSDRQLDAQASERGLRLSRLVPLWPAQIDMPGEAAARRVIHALERALREERRRGRAGHWSYDINRHLALARALRDERARMADPRKMPDTACKTARRPHAGTPETKSLILPA